MQKTDVVLPDAPESSPGALAAAACLDPFVEAWGTPDDAPGREVVEILRKAAEHHAELIASTGLAGEPPAEWSERAEKLLEYRRGIDGEMLDPLGEMYGSVGPTAGVEATLQRAADECERLCNELPETVSVPWPDDALSPRPSDTAGRRFGKAVAKFFSAARKTGEERALPLRAVAADHLARSVAPGQDRVAASAVTAWGTWSRSLERLWVEWGRFALPALVRAELPDEEGDDVEEVWTTVRDAAQALQEGLEGLLADVPTEAVLAEVQAALDVARGALEADLAVAGSFLYTPQAKSASATYSRLGVLGPALREWDEGVQARLELNSALLSILSGATAVQRRMVWRFRDRCLKQLPGLLEAGEKLEALAREATVASGRAALRSRVEDLDKAVIQILGPTKEVMPVPGVAEAAVREISENTIEALSAMIRQAPTSLELHSPAARVPSGAKKAETRTLSLQEYARQAFDALRVERIRSSTQGLLTAVDEMRTNIAELDGVYSFARDEALRELESDEEGAEGRAQDLLRGALRGTAEALRNQVSAMDVALRAAQNRLAAEVSEGSMALLDRVDAGRVEARLFAARSRMTQLRAWVTDRWGPPVARVGRYLGAGFLRLKRFATRWLRRGSAMVGSGPAETAESTRTLRTLSDVKAQTEGIPLVYRRLFTLEPISDPAIFAGRDVQLASGMARWRRWHDDDGVPLVVRGRQGSGITSFLAVLAAKIEEDGGTVARSTLDRRMTTEAELAVYLSDLLKLPSTESLDELAHEIFEADADALPAAVALDNLEHLFLRVPGGTDLIERLLTLMAETEPRVFWIGGMAVSAWQLVATAEPTAVSQVEVLDLPPLPAEALQKAVTLRHRRSGLAIRYEEPKAGRVLLRRRLRRMRDAEGYQHLLEADFFERLHKASGGHLALALYQWLLAADFGTGEGVFMRQPERPDFSILDALALTQNFTLKAFLEHRSLTLEEHDRIFRLPRHESYQILESLRNRHLIEPLASGEDEPDARSEIEEALRYRVQPLLKGAIITHLQARNIVH